MNSLARKSQLTNLKNGSEFQKHTEESLCYVQDRGYQVKYDVSTDDGENILNLRERFERFYGDLESTAQPKLNCPIGFAALFDRIYSKDQLKESTVADRVKQAEENIKKEILVHVDDRDFIVYLGYNIILLSNRATADRKQCSEDEYCRFLSYSTVLIENHTSSHRRGTQRHILETYLYFALFHWPTESRTENDFEDFCPPKKFKSYLGVWEKAFRSNHHLTSWEQRKKTQPKMFFCLGKGSPGNDIVHLKTLEEKWKEMKENSGTFRPQTAKDEFWNTELYQQELMWMNGVVSGNGKQLSFEVEYPQGTHMFTIQLYKIRPELSNREVKFVVGFTWEGPAAVFVNVNVNQGPAALFKACKQTFGQEAPVRKKEMDIRETEEHKTLSEATNSEDKAVAYTIIKDIGESVNFVDALVSDKLHHAVICCIGGDLGERKNAFHMIVIHAQTRTGVFYFPNDVDDKAIMKDGKLENVFQHTEITKVYHDVHAVSSSLINEFDILIDGTPVWDIEIVFRGVEITEDEADGLKKLGYTKDIFETWKEENKLYSRLLSGTDLSKEMVQSMIERGKLISKMFEICERKIDEHKKRSLRKEIFEAVNSGNSEKIKQLKEAKKGMAAGKQKKKTQKLTINSRRKGSLVKESARSSLENGKQWFSCDSTEMNPVCAFSLLMLLYCSSLL